MMFNLKLMINSNNYLPRIYFKYDSYYNCYAYLKKQHLDYFLIYLFSTVKIIMILNQNRNQRLIILELNQPKYMTFLMKQHYN